MFAGLLIPLCGAVSLLILFLSGCGMDVDRNAVRIDLVFYEPEKFPFMKLYRLERDEEGGFSSARITPETSEEEIKELLKDGYRKKYLTFARIYLYTLDTGSGQWIPIDQYSIHYGWLTDNNAKWWFGQGILYPVKAEEYYPRKAVLACSHPGYPYASMTSTMLIFDFWKRFSVTMKIVVVPSDGSADARYWITNITREDIRINAEDYFKEKSLFDWRISIPEAKIILPPWNKWHIEPNPPKPTGKWEPPPKPFDIKVFIPGTPETSAREHGEAVPGTAAVLCTQAGPGRQTVSPLLAEKFGIFFDISGKIRNENRRTKAGEEMPLVEIHAVNGSPVAVVTLPLAAFNPGTREKLRSLRDGETVKFGGFESLEAVGFPDVPGEPSIQHAGYGIRNVFVVMKR